MNRLDIQTNLDHPGQLEKLYRENKADFKREFNLLYPELKGQKLADFWYERLNYESPEISWGSNKELIFVIIISLVAAFIAKLHVLLNSNQESFYERNTGFIVFPVLTIYFIRKMGLPVKKILVAGAAFLIAVIFINLLPADHNSDTLVLSCVHLPLFLWTVLGFSYLGDDSRDFPKRIGFLRYNGDLVIMTALILIAGAILSGVTIGLFSAIGMTIEKFYFDYIIVPGLAAVPVVATFITQTNPQLVNRVSPVIAKIFAPLVLITLLVYLPAILFSGKDPYRNREFLMVFNFLLIGVMAIILFSVAASFKKKESPAGGLILLALSVVTIVVNGIALSAILFRISEWGMSPNRLAVLGGNILMLTNLLMVSYRLFKYVSKKAAIREVEDAIAGFLPVYGLWTIVVTFIFPFLFHFR